MNGRKKWLLLAGAALALGGFALPGRAQAPPAQPQKETLAFPLPVPKLEPGATQCRITFGPPACVTAVAFGPEGKVLAAAGYEEVLIWDLAEARLARRIGNAQRPAESQGRINALQFVDQGRLLAVADGLPGQPAKVKLYDWTAGAVKGELAGPAGPVLALSLSVDGKLLAGGSEDRGVYVWNIAERKVVTTIKEHSDAVHAVAFSPDGKTLATGGADMMFNGWDTEKWKSAFSVRVDEPIYSVGFNADCTLIVAGSGGPGGRAVRMRKVTDDNRDPRYLYTDAGIPLGLVWPGKGPVMYTACSDRTIKAVSGTERRVVATWTGHADWVYSIAATADATRLASGSGDGTVRLWRVADGKCLATLVQATPAQDPWAILTAAGYWAASDGALLQWDAKGQPITPQALAAMFQNVDLVKKALAGQDVPPPAVK